MADTDTRLRIKEKAHGLFMQYGLRSVSMDDIANSLGISKKTIYQFYADKDELVDAVVEGEFQRNEINCEYDRSHSSNAVHEVFMAMEMMAELFSSMNPALIFDMQKYYPKAFLKFHKHKNDYLFNVVRDNILRGIKEELYRDNINVDVIARFRIESMLISFNPEFNSKFKINIAEMEAELIIHFLYGLVSVKGYKLVLKYQQECINKLNDTKK